VAPIDFILSDLASAIISRLPEFLGHEELDDLLIENKLKTDRLTRLLQVLRGLLTERAPIVKIAAIHAHVEAAPATLTVGELLAQVRLLPRVCPDLPGNNARAVLRKLPPEHEQLFQNALVEHGPEKVIAMPIEDCQTLIESVRTIMMEEPPANALVVNDEVIRPFLRRFIAEDYPRLAVLSAREVASVRKTEEIREAPAAVSV
jgi:flagellar biosynthesis component FlhA